MKPYMYVFIRKDLPHTQKIVQSSHVAFELSKKYQLDTHPSMVLIGVRDLIHLEKEIKNIGKDVIIFRDNIFNNEITAFGVMCLTNEERILFKKYQCLKESDFYSENDKLIKKAQDSILKKKSCTHKSYRLDMEETLAYEYTPVKKCNFCNFTTRVLSESEKLRAVKKFYKNILETELDDGQAIKIKDGFNL